MNFGLITEEIKYDFREHRRCLQYSKNNIKLFFKLYSNYNYVTYNETKKNVNWKQLNIQYVMTIGEYVLPCSDNNY